jgi:hypothetical protein
MAKPDIATIEEALAKIPASCPAHVRMDCKGFAEQK